MTFSSHRQALEESYVRRAAPPPPAALPLICQGADCTATVREVQPFPGEDSRAASAGR